MPLQRRTLRGGRGCAQGCRGRGQGRWLGCEACAGEHEWCWSFGGALCAHSLVTHGLYVVPSVCGHLYTCPFCSAAIESFTAHLHSMQHRHMSEHAESAVAWLKTRTLEILLADDSSADDCLLSASVSVPVASRPLPLLPPHPVPRHVDGSARRPGASWRT